MYVYLPFRGEFGHLIMWHAPYVNSFAGEKIVCCERGQEALFPNAVEYFYVDSRKEDKTKTADVYKYEESFFRSIMDEIGKRFETVRFVKPIGEFGGGSKKYISYKPYQKYGIDCDIVICPRKRMLAEDRNWQYWSELTEKLQDRGYKVFAAGSPSSSYDVPCAKAWDYERFLDASIEAINNSTLVVCTDNGLAHLSVQCGKDILMIICDGKPGPDTNWQVKWKRFYEENHLNVKIDSVDAWNDLNMVLAAIDECFGKKNSLKFFGDF